MKKYLLITTLIVGSFSIANATCSLDGSSVCTETNDLNTIRRPYKPIYQDLGDSANFENPFIRLTLFRLRCSTERHWSLRA